MATRLEAIAMAFVCLSKHMKHMGLLQVFKGFQTGVPARSLPKQAAKDGNALPARAQEETCGRTNFVLANQVRTLPCCGLRYHSNNVSAIQILLYVVQDTPAFGSTL